MTEKTYEVRREIHRSVKAALFLKASEIPSLKDCTISDLDELAKYVSSMAACHVPDNLIETDNLS